jgi:hypothetical protein
VRWNEAAEARGQDEQHALDYHDIDELDEIGAGEQLVLVRRDTHGDYEWHWVPLEDLPCW